MVRWRRPSRPTEPRPAQPRSRETIIEKVTRHHLVDFIDREGPVSDAALHEKFATASPIRVLDDILDDLVDAGTIRVSHLQTNPPTKRYSMPEGLLETPGSHHVLRGS